MTKMAVCTRCREPLIMTMVFRKNEFYCVNCGNLYGYFGPNGEEPTPELIAKYEANKREWDNLSAGIIGDGVHLTACPNCNGDESHRYHATAEELRADVKARRRLEERRNRIIHV